MLLGGSDALLQDALKVIGNVKSFANAEEPISQEDFTLNGRGEGKSELLQRSRLRRHR